MAGKSRPSLRAKTLVNVGSSNLSETDKQCMESVFEKFEALSKADVVKHGEWFTLDNCANEGVYCSVCHKKVYKKCYANQKLKSKHCPNCGAKMDGSNAE